MQILFVAVDSQYIHSNLALRYLYKLSDLPGCRTGFMETTVNDDVDQVLQELAGHGPDLVVFSCYIWNIEYTRKLISALRVIRPETVIACGGPEVAYSAEAFLKESPADIVMAGEGEAVFPPLLEALLHNESRGAAEADLSGCPGLFYRCGETIMTTQPADLVDMATIPFPYDEEQFQILKDRLVYYEGQRGCPYGCTYCLSSIDRTIRHKPLDKVKTELKCFMEARVPLVKFVDRTFNVREDWAYEVLSFILEQREQNGYETSFHLEVGAATLSRRTIALFNASPPGLFQIEAGIQSTDRKVLALIDRQDDQDRLTEALGKIIAGGRVHVHTDLIAGLPGDTLESFRRSFNDCMAMGPDMLQVGFLKVLKGTPLDRQRERYGIRHRAWPPYEVLQTGTMSYADLQTVKKIEVVTDRFYNSGKFSASMRFLLNKSEKPWDLFNGIANNLSIRQKDRSPLKFEKYYSVIKDLCQNYSMEEQLIMADLLRFDYVRGNRSGHVPEDLRDGDYNSQRTRLLCKNRESYVLKGSVVRFNIDVLLFFYQGEIRKTETWLFCSPGTRELIPVIKDAKGEYVHA